MFFVICPNTTIKLLVNFCNCAILLLFYIPVDDIFHHILTVVKGIYVKQPNSVHHRFLLLITMFECIIDNHTLSRTWNNNSKMACMVCILILFYTRRHC